MDLLEEYLSYLSEEDDEKKSKWKERAKKALKIAGLAAASGLILRAGYKKALKDRPKLSPEEVKKQMPGEELKRLQQHVQIMKSKKK